MSDANNSENVGGVPLPPARNRTKPTVIRPASKIPDATGSNQPPPRPAPPGARPPPPAVPKQNNEGKINKPDNQDQPLLSNRSSVNGPASTPSPKPGSGKKKLEITIIDARPMSEAGFRDLKVGMTSPTVTSPTQPSKVSDQNACKQPDLANKVEQDGPPKPSRMSISRPSVKQAETVVPPPKPSRPAALPTTEAVVPESSSSKDSVVPQRPSRPTIIRPQKLADQKSAEDGMTHPAPARPKPPHMSTVTVDPPRLSPTPRPRSSVISPEESVKSISPPEEIKNNHPVPSPRPAPRNTKDIPSKSETQSPSGLETSQKSSSSTLSNGSSEGSQAKFSLNTSQLEPPQRPKRPSAHPKPITVSKQSDDFTDDSPVYAKIVKPSNKITNNDVVTSEVKSEPEMEPPALPKPALKPKPLSRSDSGKMKIAESITSPEDVFTDSKAEVVMRPKSNVSANIVSSNEIKPGHISENFLARFEHNSNDSHSTSEKSGPPLPAKRPVTVIGGPHRTETSKLSIEKTENKDPNASKSENQNPIPQKVSASIDPLKVTVSPQQVSPAGDNTDVKKQTRPDGPPPRPVGGSPPSRENSSQQIPDGDASLKKQPSFSEDKKKKDNVPSGSGLITKEKPERPKSIERPASIPSSKPTRPVALPRRPGPGHPLYHHMAKVPHGIAVHDYTARQEDELTFKKGDTVVLMRKEDKHWFAGKVGNKEGLFPANYIDVRCPLPDENLPAASVVGSDAGACAAVDAETTSVQGPRCRARFDFEGEGDGDLTFEDGDMVQILERVGTEWLRGEHKGRKGIFPVSFVEIIEDLQSGNKGYDMQVTAVADFNGHDGELTFLAGATINALSQVNNEWLYGEYLGKKGRFPASFVSHVPLNLPEYRPYKKPQAKTAVSVQNKPAVSVQNKPPESTAEQSSDTLQQVADEFINVGPALLQRSKETIKGYCRGRFDYLDPPLGDLEFRAGDRIEILEFFGEDWARGRLGKKEGMIPLNLVAEEIIDPDIVEEPEVKEKVLGKVVHDFQGETENDLTIKEGDIIEMEEIADTKGHWRWGQLNGKRGMFPVMFVEAI